MGCCRACDVGHACDGEAPAQVAALPTEAGIGDLRSFAKLTGGKLRPVATRLVLAHAVANASEPVELENCRAGSVDVVLFKLAQITSVEVFVEATTDGENYRRLCATVLKSEGAVRVRFRNASWRFLRLYYVATGSQGGIGVLAATLSGSQN